MAEFNVKTISCSSKITAKIELNIGSLECEYKGNKLDFKKKIYIDSGKGSNFPAVIFISAREFQDFGKFKYISFGF